MHYIYKQCSGGNATGISTPTHIHIHTVTHTSTHKHTHIMTPSSLAAGNLLICPNNTKQKWKLDPAAFLSALCQWIQGRRRDSGVYKIKRWGDTAILLRREVGGESFTHPQGRSQSLASDLTLKEGNLGEGGRNMSEQSK